MFHAFPELTQILKTVVTKTLLHIHLSSVLIYRTEQGF